MLFYNRESIKSPWCGAFPRSFSDFSTVLTLPSFVKSLSMKRVVLASVNWVAKQLWIISSVTSTGTFLRMTARFGFSVEGALLIFVESPRNSGFHFWKTSSASSVDTNSKWTFPLVVLKARINLFSWKCLSNSSLICTLSLKLNVLEAIKMCSGLRCGLF